MRDGYSICFNEWALDKEIKNELNLLLIISSLCAEKGYCFASNKYLADLFDITEQSVSNKIKKLESIGYLLVEYKYRGTEVISREIRIKNIYTDHIKKIIPTIEKNQKDNNISNNNNRKEIYKEKYGEFGNVLLTKEEYHKLEQSNLLQYIEKLSSYIASKGKRYKSHYATILTWARNENKTEAKSFKKQSVEPEWLGKEIKQEEMSEKTRRMLEYVNGKD